MKEHSKKCKAHLSRVQWIQFGMEREGKVLIRCSDMECALIRGVSLAEAEELCRERAKASRSRKNKSPSADLAMQPARYLHGTAAAPLGESAAARDACVQEVAERLDTLLALVHPSERNATCRGMSLAISTLTDRLLDAEGLRELARRLAKPAADEMLLFPED